MPRKNLKTLQCVGCGRIWTPRDPDRLKFKCPSCGKYKVEEVKEDGSKCDNNNGSCSDGLSVPPADPVDPADPDLLSGDPDDPIVAGEKEVSVLPAGSASSGVSGSPLEKEIDPPRNPPIPASGLGGGGLWIGLGVLVVGGVSALWYLYQRRSLAEDAEEILSDDPRPAGGGESDLYGRGRAAYRRGAF